MTYLTTKLPSVLALVALLATAGCDDDPAKAPSTSSAAVPSGKAPQIVAAKTAHDFGKIKQGKEVAHVFEIRNAGTAPLLISKAKGS
ncbi:MAG: DUF1573 domain-containing protein [Deltaproteobacteria bacterium]|jgi:hypothetical protein|nr:DUF1573 domain-containing protein [Deltaproteobacteria bacterium]MBW2533660.1 DUF1573 domain-containing protein [Deltaproteobacteria bacterium]